MVPSAHLVPTRHFSPGHHGCHLCWLPASLGLCLLQTLGSCEEAWVDSAICFQFRAVYLWEVFSGVTCADCSSMTQM